MAQNTGYDNRRKYPRLAVQLPIKYKRMEDGGSPFTREITNTIGEGGLFIRTKNGYETDTKVELEVTVRDRSIEAHGVVRYLIPYDASAGGVQFPGIGVQFTAIANEDQEFIGDFVKEGLRKSQKKQP